jgi:hypothetical protein
MNYDTGEQAHATFTPWRALNTILLLGLGAYKAIATYRGQTIGPTTADWLIGVVWTLMYVFAATSLRVY